MVFGSQYAGGDDGDLFIFGQEGHSRKGRFGTYRAPDNEIGLFVQDQLFHGQQSFTDRHARLRIAGVDHLHRKGPLGAAHVDSSGGIDFLNGQADAPFRIPPI